VAFTPGSTPFGLFDADPEFQADADRLDGFVRLKLGEPIVCVHLSASNVYAAFEEACMDYSAIVNSYQAKSALSQYLGSPTGSLSGSENRYPSRNIEMQKRLAEPYGEEANLNGPHPLYSGSIDLVAGQQKYDLQRLLSGTLSASFGDPNVRIYPKEVFHFSPLSAFRFFGTTSAVNYLNSQFQFESFTPETIFYLLPIWEDILRGMQFETSNRVRRSHYSFEMRNNELTLYPCPTENMPLFFTYRLAADPTVPANEQESRSFAGVSNLSNVPFGNIQYGKLNSIGRAWIRRMAFALAKEIEGQIRAKVSSIPIPNGDLTLNGPELISDARAEMEALRGELKELLEDMTYDKLAEKEAAMAESVERTIQLVPLGIFVG
jgi:hypothetical protein